MSLAVFAFKKYITGSPISIVHPSHVMCDECLQVPD
uniref:Uncharacterized protein n=1 Tax=Arundo donax TaxID=35708 RepID=A0A0A9E535_ARUDO